MQRTPVSSSQIASVGYDERTRTLEVEFVTRKDTPPSVYRYRDVPAAVHAEFLTAPSLGIYFGANIKTRYKTLKINPDTGEAVELVPRPASAKSMDFLRVLLTEQNYLPAERTNASWRRVAEAAGRTMAEGEPVDAWLAQLTQDEASNVINWLKGKA